MTTPTKEQIKQVMKKKSELNANCGFCIGCNFSIECFDDTKKTIILWEKIKEIKECKKMSVYCGNCKHNPMGVCELANKEIPESYVIRRNKLPVWCPLKKGKK